MFPRRADTFKPSAKVSLADSKLAEIRGSIKPGALPLKPATPQTLESWEESGIHKAAADALSELSGHAEFREPIRHAIPEIIDLLWDKELNIRRAGADALSKLLEHAEFRESIRPAIPRLITLLDSWEELDIRKVVANSLLKLSEHAEFRESIQSAIPQINALLSDPDKKINQSGARTMLPQVPGQPTFLSHWDAGPTFPSYWEARQQWESVEAEAAISQHTAFLRDIDRDVDMGSEILAEQETDVESNVDSEIIDSVEGDSWTTTCWIAAEHALQRARNNMSSISEVFGRWQLQESEYVVHAGFDESLISSGIGYLEQIHVFTIAEIDATSPLLSELGKLFSPFSSILFTESSTYHLPVYKDDGSVWEFDELVYFTASKFADDGSNAKTPLSVIGFSQTPVSEGVTGFSSSGSGSGSGEEEKSKKRRSEKGKGRDMGDEDEDEANEDPNPSDDPDDPPGDQGGIIAEPVKISFEIATEIQDDDQNTFQTLTMHGGLTIKTTPLAQDPL